MRLESVARLSADDKAMLSLLPMRVQRLPAKADVVMDGDHPTDSCLLLEGVLCRYKMLGVGARQILSFHFAGDLPDLHSLYVNRLDHAIAAITPVRVAFIAHDALRNIAARNPGIAAALTTQVVVDAAIFREWITNVGRRPALARLAHLLCELFLRMPRVRHAEPDGMILPLTQTDLADAAGLSPVHVNRVMQSLRRLGLIQSNGQHHKIIDWQGLQLAGGFDEAYLHLRHGSLI